MEPAPLPQNDAEKDRKALVRACRALEGRYDAVVILVSYQEGKETKRDFEMGGNRDACERIADKFSQFNYTFDPDAEDMDDDEGDEWKPGKGKKGDGPEPA